jgi:hypothetical protein
MGIALGAKIDARFRLMEAKVQDDQIKAAQQMYQILNEVIELRQRVDALEAKRGPGRPKKDEALS